MKESHGKHPADYWERESDCHARYRRQRTIQTVAGVALIFLGGGYLLFSDFHELHYPQIIAAWALIALGGLFVNEQVTRHWLSSFFNILPFRDRRDHK